MRVVVQRVTRASVRVEEKVVGEITEPGLMVLVGVTHDDTSETAEYLARKVAGLRILRQERSVVEEQAPVLVVSQFTLYADTRKGRRPSWSAAAPASMAAELVDHFTETLRRQGIRVQSGIFGADMQVELVNDGPVTLVLES